MRRPSFVFVLLLFSSAAAANDLLDRLADPETAPYRITGKGFITDSGHPLRPGYFKRTEVAFRILLDPRLGEAELEFESIEEGQRPIDRYYVRRGRIFQLNEKGEETDCADLGDLSPATVAALHTAIVAQAIRERPENLRRSLGGAYVLAWGDELWSVQLDGRRGRITKLTRRVTSDRFGDGVEEVRYGRSPDRVIVTSLGRELARIEFESVEKAITMNFPAGNRRRDRARVVAAVEIEPREVASHLFAIELASMNTRVFVAEFADHVVVLEGAYNSRICDLVARKVRERFSKPVRYFAFSHLHAQYVGGTRSWVHEGATVVVPETTVPLIETIVKARHDLHPDALARDPKPLRIETVKDRRRLEDATNALEILNIESGHTDEYFIFYFPGQKVLLTGDLLFYRPGETLTGRSKQLCDTVEKLGLDVERIYVTWPLDGYGTKNIVSGDELRSACGKGG